MSKIYIGEKEINSGGGGGGISPTDLTNYYTKSEIDASISNFTYTKSEIRDALGEVEYALDGITDDIEHLDINKADKTEVYTRNFIDTSINSLNTRIVDVSSYAQDVSARMPIFEYNSATQTLNIIA